MGVTMVLTRDALILVVLSCLLGQTVKSQEEKVKVEKGNRTFSCGLTNATSTRNASNVRIIQAQEAEKGAWPWMAEIFIKDKRNTSRAICGGALLNNFYVITAANCLMTTRRIMMNPEDLIVRLGDHNLEKDDDGMKPINYNVTSVNAHEEFDPITFQNDIALLRLDHSVVFNNHIQPVCLPDDEILVTDEERGPVYGYATGWGTTSYNGPASDVLMEMSAIITNDEFCREAYEDKTSITDKNICSVGVNGSSPCQGFGGGPVVLPGRDNRYHIIGIVSFGYHCGIPEYPDVSTRVSEFLDWIGQYVA